MRLTTVGFIATLTLAILVVPLAAMAQPPTPSPKVGWLEGSGRTDKEPLHAVFLQGLRELGYVEGQNLILVRRDMEGQPDRLPALAAELVQLPVDVIVPRSASQRPVRPCRRPRPFPSLWRNQGIQ
jgi:putative tryptophan/tyrosine transport system substrate-binding protein